MRRMGGATRLAAGLLDVLSLGTSQLSQSAFGEDWGRGSMAEASPSTIAEEFSDISGNRAETDAGAGIRGNKACMGWRRCLRTG